MSNIVDLNEFRKKKQLEAEEEMAHELHYLLSQLMLNDEPVIITVTDSNGVESLVDLDELLGLKDSNS